MELILAPESAPFTTAIIFVILLGTLEAVSLLLGASLSGFFDHVAGLHLGADIEPSLDADVDVDVDLSIDADSGLGWLHLGKVPVLVLLVLFLSSFAIVGFSCNAIVYSFLDSYPPALLSSAIAFLSALLVVRVCGAALAKVIPTDESSAVSLKSLVGHVAVVVNGTARKNYPAQARVTTEKGQTFYVRVEPESATEQFKVNDSVLLVKQISGTRFLACANPLPELL